MKHRIIKLFSLTTILALLILGLPKPAQAAMPDRLIIGSTFTLENGESLDDDLMIVGGQVTLEEGSTLNGTIILLGGSLEISGQVNGDVVVAGGSLKITATAKITGDVTTAGTSLQRDPQAEIVGKIITEQEGPFIVTPRGINVPQVKMAMDPFFSFIGFILRIFLWALLAMLVALFLPGQLNHVARTAVSQPIISGGLGLLTLIAVPIIVVVIALTILLIPVSLVGMLLLVLAWAFGLISLGTELGQRFAGIFNRQWHPALAAGLGTFLLILVINGAEALIPCLGIIPKIIVGVLGLGAVTLTRFGTQPYQVSSEQAPPPASLSMGE
jgi:cytoskeletal protein CcmA (bactofilin family)